MTAIMPDSAVHRPVTALPACELERRVLDAGLRPCAAPGANPEAWFPTEPGSGNSAKVRALYEARALVLCRGCPVAIECLELAMLREGPARGHGISGGTTPWQRQQIKASRAVRRG
jgi:Transcription factor WhiB